jgi:hypothetical protein
MVCSFGFKISCSINVYVEFYQSRILAGTNLRNVTSRTEYFDKQAGEDKKSAETRLRAGMVTYVNINV